MEIVSAGDIEKYAYCPLSWWLSKKHKVVNIKGVERHKKIKDELEEIKTKEERLKLYEKYIMLISIAATIVAIMGLAFAYGEITSWWKIFILALSFLWLYNSLFFLYKASKAPVFVRHKYEKIILLSAAGAIMVATLSIIFSLPPSPAVGRFSEILALLWVISANLLFYHSLNISEEIIEKKIKYSPINGKIEYIGESSEGREIVSEKYGIKGKPDYIIKIGDDYIPVEEKSFESSHPKFSHVMQITAYCMLIESEYEKSPPYGILKYPNHEFKIPYEERWRNMVIKIRENMLQDMKKGEAHRNHDNKKKCTTCARREYCPERLI